MKHIFFIHSPITYLVSVATIKTMKLPEKNVLFICDGFRHSYGNIATVDLRSFYPSKGVFRKLYAALKYFSRAGLIDGVINRFTGRENFEAYIPVMRFVEKLIVTHEKCARFNFIEEGMVHYSIGETLDSLTLERARDPWRWNLSSIGEWRKIFSYFLDCLRGYNSRLRSLPFSYCSYRNFPDVSFIGLTKNAFPMAQPEKIRLVELPGDIAQNVNGLDLNNKVIWIGDNGVDHYGYSKEVYLEGLTKGFIGYLEKKGICEIYLKFHRGENPGIRAEQEELFRQHGITVKIIPDNVIMEPILAGSKNVVLCGVYSSLLFYANIMGHETYSIYTLVKSEYERNLKGKDFRFIWDKIKQIETAI